MTKRQLAKHLITKWNASKTRFKPYDFEVTVNQKTYHILILNLSSNQQLTINSKYIWDIASGRLNGIRFSTTSKRRINLQDFLRVNHPIVVLVNKPYRILKYINESEVVDISQEKSVHNIPLFFSVKDLDEFLNN